MGFGGCSTPVSLAERSSAVASGLAAAWNARDKEAFLAWFSNVTLGETWFRNLSQFTDVTFESGGVDGDLIVLRVSEKVPLDVTSARHRLGIATTGSPAGALLAAARTTPRPIWVGEPITVTTQPRSTVLSGTAVSTADWSAAANDGVHDVAAHCPPTLVEGWSGAVVVAVPALLGTFADAMGVTQDAYRDVAAVAWAEGSATDAPMRVFVNELACRGLAAIDRRVLLAHETTHVATQLTLPKAPHWVSEGLAERVGLSGSPAHRAHNRALAKTAARKTETPLALPVDADFEPGATDLQTVYALSEQAVAGVFSGAGDAKALAFFLAVGAGKDWPIPLSTVTQWYRDQLSSL